MELEDTVIRLEGTIENQYKQWRKILREIYRQERGMETGIQLGYSHGKKPIDGSEAVINMPAPGVIRDHFTASFTRYLAGGHEFSLSLMYAPEEMVTGRNLFDPTQTIELAMHQFEVELGYRF